jgi:hypothetical protein
VTHDDRPEFSGLMYMLAETFNEPLSPIRIEGY